MPPLDKVDEQENVPARSSQSPCRYEQFEPIVLVNNQSARHDNLNLMLDSPLIHEESPIGNCERTGVAFSEKNSLHAIPGLEDFSEQELADCWYKAPDFTAFRAECLHTAHLHRMHPNRIDDIEYTLRGIEHKVKEVSDRRNELRWRARRAVLLEQKFQECIGEASPDRLAEEYAHVTVDAIYDAINIAAIDEMQVLCFRSESFLDETFSDRWISSVSSNDQENEDLYGIVYRAIVKEENLAAMNACFDDSWLHDGELKELPSNRREELSACHPKNHLQ